MASVATQPWMGLLKQVSRSFYLTLRVLPGAIRPQLGLAYILARTTDSIADTDWVPLDRRRAALRDMRAAIRAVADARRAEAPDFGELTECGDPAGHRGSAAERALLKDPSALIELLGDLPPQDRQRIADLLEIIIRGQETDLVRFGSAGGDRITALKTDDELEEYTYCVAGCVGEFWTKMCRTHLFPKAELDDTFLLCSGIRFGKGLQLVNILRDLPQDLRHGRCYMPSARLAELGLEPAALLDRAAMGLFRPLYAGYLKQAEELLAAGWVYTNALPRNQIRLRLACAWPILIGVRTLAQLRTANVLDERRRVKVSRGEVRALMLRSILCYANPNAWDRLFLRAGTNPHRWKL